MVKGNAYFVFKRVLDIFFSFILIVLLLPLMIFLYVLIVCTSRGGGIFKQIRVGRSGESFVCYKFRTMYEDAPSYMPSADFCCKEKCITPVGRILRRTSLDELPQLFNVFLGDMSLVGPRPLIPNEGDIHYLRKRCGVYSIRPGMTGLAQINGRTDIDDIEKIRLDVRYLKNMSLVEDLRIILGTVLMNYK